jgi:hypothetical protein
LEFTALLTVLSILATLLAARMPSSDERTRARVPHSASDYRAARRTPSLTVIVLLLLRLRLLALLLGRRRR